MNETELCDALGIAPLELADWLAAGLPCDGADDERRFDPAAVRAWLVARGLADAGEPDVILGTQREVAAFFGVEYETALRSWRPKGMPGEEGRYSVREISRWLAGRYALGSGAESDSLNSRRKAEVRKLEADAALRELKLEMQRGEYCEVAYVRTRFAEIATRCRDTLMRLPAELRPILPAEFAPMICGEVESKVRGVLEMLAKRLCEIADDARVDADGNLINEEHA